MNRLVAALLACEHEAIAAEDSRERIVAIVEAALGKPGDSRRGDGIVEPCGTDATCERCGGSGVYLVENHGPQEVACECRRNDAQRVEPDQVRVNATGDGRIKIFGCYGCGSGGALYSVSVVNMLESRSVSGMSESDIAESFPIVESFRERRRLDASTHPACGAGGGDDEGYTHPDVIGCTRPVRCGWCDACRKVDGR